jgi:hypothetical protein
VDAIIAKCAGEAKRPVRIADDGSVVHVFKLVGELFPRLSIHPVHEPDFARVESAGFVPVNGSWRDDMSLVDVLRHELAELDHERAQRLIAELDALLDAHAAPVAPPAPYIRRPLLERGQRLLYGNTRAMDALREHGFRPVPVRWGHDDVERDGYNDFLGHWHYNADVSEHGVGISLKGFALVEFVTRFRADVDHAIRAMGVCLVRTADDDHPAYLFRCDQGGGDGTIYSPNAPLRVRRIGVTVLSGADVEVRAYKWSRDVLTVMASDLSAFEVHDAKRLERTLESLPATDYSNTPKRRKTT